MAYRIRYGPDKKRQPQKNGKFLLAVNTFAFFILFLLVANHYFPEEITALRHIILPSDSSNPVLQDLQEGQSIGQIVSAFCQEIFHGK